ncbi:MAG: cation-transporting P-type ATPase [Spirochaetes bacterium]|nr:cation-transporting P-type ATPase [Spirochaetota bacterium]
METLLNEHWHHLPEEELLHLFKSDREKGLDSFEVKHRREHFGPNMLTAKKKQNPLVRFLLQFHQPLVYILLAASIITLVLGEYIDSAVIFAVIFVNAIVGFLQESKAIEALEALSKSLKTESTVIRSGVKTGIGSEEIVPGDIVLLKSGDKVPADMRLLYARDLKIDESVLTGESLPIEKRTSVLGDGVILAERHNMAYSSTLVTYGQGTGLVVGTGDRTEVGKISELLNRVESIDTPLTQKISHFSHILLYVILGMAVITFAVGLLRGQDPVEMFLAAVALAVGAIPEGLPAALTIILAIGVSRMAKRNAIIRKPPAVETLGSTMVICTDKTGTITENQMTVTSIVAGGSSYEVTGTGYKPEGKIMSGPEKADPLRNAAMKETLTAGLLCNDSTLSYEGERWDIKGDPTEGALLVSYAKSGLPEEPAEAKARRDTIPFESEYQYMATLHESSGGAMLSYAKGAVEVMLEKCSAVMNADGSTSPLDKNEVIAGVESLAGRGLRVLGFAKKEFPSSQTSLDHEDLADGMVFLGIQAMFDPPRKEAIEAIKACHSAGIRVKMITGDHAITAKAIADLINLDCSGSACVHDTVTGSELAMMTDEEIKRILDERAVFARVTPEQKLRLVEALQATGNVAAMTGDGVNDAPALKQANIGISMGITGTEVAKEAADMVLTDDNFATIVAAVEEGRAVFDNIKKFIVWTLPTNLGEGLVILAAIMAGVALPVLPIHVLWINMSTALLLGLMLAFEIKEPGLMNRKPRDPEQPLLTPYLLVRIVLVASLMLGGAFGFYEWALQNDFSMEQARTTAVNVFVVIEILYLFNSRSLKKPLREIGFFSNPSVFLGSGIMLVLQLLFTYAGPVNVIFQTAPIPAWFWGVIVAYSLVVYGVVNIHKRFSKD